MSSDRLRRRRWWLWVLVPLGIAVAAGSLLFDRLERNAGGLLGRWETSGLPGRRPAGHGPVLIPDWPPRLRWSDLRWDDGRSVTASCRRLDLRFAPVPLLTGKLRVVGVELSDLQVQTSGRLGRWVDRIVSTLPQATGSDGPRGRPAPSAIWIEVDSLRLDSMEVALARISGWCWSPRRGSWELSATATTTAGARLDLALGGSGVAGFGELSVQLDLAPGRSLRFERRRPIDGPTSWRLQGRDDGSLLTAVLSAPLAPSEAMPAGTIDIDLAGSTLSAPEGEVRIGALRIGGPQDDPWLAEGLVCIGGGVATLEGFHLTRERVRLDLETSFPIGGEDPVGPFRISGVWNEEPVEAGGSIRAVPGGWELVATTLRRGRATAGPARLVWLARSAREASGAGRESAFRGEARLGGGTLLWTGGTGSLEAPAILRAEGIPLSRLEPWLPFRLPGSWSGALDASARLHRSGGEWAGGGTVLLREGRVAGLALIDEVARWRGAAPGRAGVGFDTLRADWILDRARLLAENLEIDAGSMRVRGVLLYTMPDSLFGLLQISPSRDRTVGAILRLLGGKTGGIDLGVEGSAARPTLRPLDRKMRRSWGERIDRLREDLAAAPQRRAASASPPKAGVR